MLNRLLRIIPGFQPNESLINDFDFHDPWDAPFRISGLHANPEREYYRVPPEVAEATSPSVARLSLFTAGACVRFATDAKQIALITVLRERHVYGTMTVNGVSSPEVYIETDGPVFTQAAILRPPFQEDNLIDPVMECRVPLPGEGMRTVCLYLPLCNGVRALYIGLPKGSVPAAPRTRAIETPILFYGSSITQGMCAAMPGSCYSAILGRRLDAAVRNLGFAGSALGEKAIAEYIAEQEMSAFILDYDHNAPTPEHLKATHEPLFRIVREKHPDLPVIMLTRPNFESNPEENTVRRDVVRETYENALAAGDKNVYFIDGETFYGPTERGLCYADDVHPNTLGFLRMADAVEPVLRKAMKLDA